MQIGQGEVTGYQKTTPDQRADSLQNDPELVNGNWWRRAHPNTVAQFAPGNLRSLCSPVHARERNSSRPFLATPLGLDSLILMRFL
jgi:hypothetical protein